MGDYTPKHATAEDFPTFVAGGTITGGDVVVFSAANTVVQASGASGLVAVIATTAPTARTAHSAGTRSGSNSAPPAPP